MKRLIFVALTVWAVSADDTSSNLGEREPFNIPLAKLSISLDEETGRFDRVKVTLEGSEEQFYISRYNDILIKNTANGRSKSLYRESPEKAYYLSDFEAKTLNRVCKTFITTLDIFESDLLHENYGHLRYLDSYMPRFLKNFYYLLCAARNSNDALSRFALVPESEYDVSLYSPKTDTRINHWKNTKDYPLKLRIISKELAYQIKQWQKSELNNSKRNPEISSSDKFDEALSLFLRIYFNTKPPVNLPEKNKHL